MTDELTYQIEYSLFLAEDEMFKSLTQFVPYVEESVALNYITEGVKETITNYLSKIAEQITKIFRKFREIFFDKKDKEYLKNIADKVEKGDYKKTTMNNFTNYDLQKLAAIKPVEFNYEAMKDDLLKKETFIQKYYNMIDPQLSISDAVKKVCIVSKRDMELTHDLLKHMYEFCTKKYEDQIKDIETDIEKVNNSNKNIQRIVGTVIGTQEAFSLIESVYLEDGENNAQPKSTPPKTTATPQPDSNNKGSGSDKNVSFTDDKEGQELEKQKKEQIVKAVTTYTTVTTNLMTEKMNNTKNCYYLYLKCLKHVIPYENPKEEEKEDEKVEVQTSNDPTQIKAESFTRYFSDYRLPF